MNILPNGVAVCGTTHHAEWCKDGLVHDPWMAGIICKHIRPGDVVVDAGAHIGTMTRAMLDAGASVLAFEPNREAFDCLCYNCPEAFPLELGLSDACGEAALHCPEENAGMAHCLPGAGVKLVDLDSLSLHKLRLIKADVEGYEAKLLRGARKTIALYHPVLILEVNPSALERAGDSEKGLLKLLTELGYTWTELQPVEHRTGYYDIEAV